MYKIIGPTVTIESITHDAEKVMERCGRTCYNSENKITTNSHAGFLRGAIRRGHFSILSFAHATFKIEGISRACSHQFVRHAHIRYLQQSQRYVNQNNPDYVIPPYIEGVAEREMIDNINIEHTSFDLFENACHYCWSVYEQLIERGVKKEDARFVLPNACRTVISASANLQGWRDFLRLRLDKHAQWEIKKVAKMIYSLLNFYVPNVFNKEMIMVQPKLDLEFPEEK